MITMAKVDWDCGPGNVTLCNIWSRVSGFEKRLSSRLRVTVHQPARKVCKHYEVCMYKSFYELDFEERGLCLNMNGKRLKPKRLSTSLLWAPTPFEFRTYKDTWVKRTIFIL